MDENNDQEMQIKEELESLPIEDSERAPHDNTTEFHHENNLNNVMVHIKEEIDNSDLDGVEREIKKEDGDLLMEIAVEDCPIEEVKREEEVKLEPDVVSDEDRMETDLLVQNYEPCYQDEIKSEPEALFMSGPFHLKQEQDVTITETQLISNKVINTTSTITSPQDGIIESQTTNTLIMQILPLPNANIGNVLDKIHNPEKILPTCSNDDDVEYDDTFQVNTITGDLTIERVGYDLLKATTDEGVNAKPFQCAKCVKSYSTKRSLRRHMEVHDCIERRINGVIQSLKTKREKYKKVKKIKKEKVSKIKVEKVNKVKVEKVNKVKVEKVNKVKEEKDKIDEQKLNSIKEEGCDEVKPKMEGYECTCGRVFRRRSRMETCLRSHNLSDPNLCYSCISCTKAFADKEQLAQHRKRLHRKRFSCKFCPTDYNTRKELFEHLQIHQKVQLMEYKVISELVKGNQKLKCFMCSKTCVELSQLKSHVLEHHQTFKCPLCTKTYSKILDFATHTKTCHPKVEGQSVLDVLEAFSLLVKAWKCEECSLQFHEADKLALHQLEMHSPDIKTEAQNQFQCPDCQRVFITQKGLTSHRRVHENTDSAEETETVDKGIMCLECRKICSDMESLTSHMRFHSPERKYPCKFCDFRFASVEKRRVHVEIHTGDMKFVCFICEYQCSSAKRLKLHKLGIKHLNMKEYLLTGKPLIEEDASKSQEKKKARLKEVDKKSKKKSKSRDGSKSIPGDGFACDICGEKFATEETMLSHKETHPFIEFPNDNNTKIFFK